MQALKFENFNDSAGSQAKYPIEDNSLVMFLIERSINDEVLGNSFYWYIAVECEDKTSGELYQDVLTTYLNRLENVSGFELTGMYKIAYPFISVSQWHLQDDRPYPSERSGKYPD